MSGTDATSPEHPDWPEGVQAISWDNIGRLGVGRDGRLYWDGRQVETRRRLDLTFWQKVIAAVSGFAIIAGGCGGLVQGIAAGYELGCKRTWWTEGCGPR